MTEIPICDQCGKPCTSGWSWNEAWVGADKHGNPISEFSPITCKDCADANRAQFKPGAEQ